MDYVTGEGEWIGQDSLGKGIGKDILFSVRIASHGQEGVLFLSGKVLSVIHQARSDVSRP